MDKAKSSVLLDKTRSFLDTASSKHGEIKRIAEGADVGIDWLYKVKQGTIKSPSPAALEAVLKFGGFSVSVNADED